MESKEFEKIEEARTPQQNKLLHSLLKELGIDKDIKEDLVLQFSNGKTDRSSHMTKEECQALIDHLQYRINTKRAIKHERKDKMRKKIIALFVKMGYTTPDGKIDMKRIYDWVNKYGYLKKPLNHYSEKELPHLVTQAEKVYHSFIQKVGRI